MKRKHKIQIFLHRKGLIKIIIAMKFIAIFFFLTTMQVYGTAYSQSAKLTLNLKNVSVTDVFKAIEDQSDFKFLYHDALISSEKNLNINLKEKTVEEILDKLFAETENTYSVLDNNLVVITPKNRNAQQEKTITGMVTDSESGDALPGVNVVVKGTTNFATTDIDGNFKIMVPSEDAILEISFVGFLSEEVAVSGQTVINISLIPDIKSLDEVVVIGYGSVKKRELTGSVASVKAENFNQGAVSNGVQLIQGKVAGLSITKNGGDPNVGYEVLLRGTSSINGSLEPLIVVDGIPGGNLDAISPEDIESIDILKDGSAAAIYGTRGTNGVIMVTTKKGQKGAMQVEFSSSYFTERVLRKIDVMNRDEYLAMKEKLLAADDADADVRQEKIDKGNSMLDYGYNTDWYNEIIRKPFSHNQYLSLSGGSEKTNYRLSFDYLDQEGILLNSSKREYKVNYNMQQMALNDKLQFNAQLGMSNNLYHPVDANAIRQTIVHNPTEPVYNPDGSMYEVPGAWQYDNPVGILTERVRDNKISRYYANIGADLKITEALKIGAVAGLQISDSLNGYYEPSYSYPQETAGIDGYARRDVTATSTKTFESTIEWKKQISSHSINFIGGYSYQDFIYEGFEATNSNFITDETEYNNLGLGTFLDEGRATMDSKKKESKLIAFFARGAYNFKGTYFLSASVRREGSSKFGANNKWGTFPAVSVAWDISQEGFLKSITFIDQLKLRAGYGVTGNQGLDDPYIPLIRYGLEGRFYYGGEYLQGFGPVSNPNPDLRWETKHEYNIGLDWLILNSRIGGTIDYYIRDTKDLLERYNVPRPPNLYSSTWQNVGSMRSSGIEFSINAVPVKKSKFKWNVDFVFDYRKNKVLSLSNDYFTLEYRNIGDIGAPGISAWTHRLEPGEPLGNIHTLVFESIDSTGKWVFRDYNPLADTAGGSPSDGVINIDDRDVVGNGIPDFYLGLTNTFYYRNFDLTIMMRGMFGHQIINAKRIWHDNPNFLPNNLMESAADEKVWDTPEFSSYYVEDGDFVKVDNITFGYTYPFKKSKWISSARIYITCLDAFLITKYSGVDPEVSIRGLEPGNDNRFDYPSTRTFMLGFNVKF